MESTNDTVPSQEPPYEAIGRVTAEGVLLEHSLKFLLVAIDFSPTLANYANAASLGQLVDLCRLATRAGVLAQTQVDEVAELLDQADKLRLARNEIVHSLWRANSDDPGVPQTLIGHRPARRRIGMSVLPSRTLEEMRSIAAEIFQLREDIFVTTYNLLLLRAQAGVEPLQRSMRIVNPHGHTSDGRSISVEESSHDMPADQGEPS